MLLSRKLDSHCVCVMSASTIWLPYVTAIFTWASTCNGTANGKRNKILATTLFFLLAFSHSPRWSAPPFFYWQDFMCRSAFWYYEYVFLVLFGTKQTKLRKKIVNKINGQFSHCWSSILFCFYSLCCARFYNYIIILLLNNLAQMVAANGTRATRTEASDTRNT